MKTNYLPNNKKIKDEYNPIEKSKYIVSIYQITATAKKPSANCKLKNNEQNAWNVKKCLDIFPEFR